MRQNWNWQTISKSKHKAVAQGESLTGKQLALEELLGQQVVKPKQKHRQDDSGP